MKFIAITALILILIGFWERNLHRKNLKKIPFIIHVNGIRGKSSTTRLTAAVLKAGGLKVLAKTTGSAAKIIYPDGREKKIKRYGPPSISEQKKIVNLAVKEKVDVLVIECMAISPEIQWSSENLFLKADLMLITNIRNDHLDKMGNNLKEIAETISLSIPSDSYLITSEKKLKNFLKEKTKQKNSEFISTENLDLSEKNLNSFEKHIFKDNLACALKTADFFNIDQKTALKAVNDVQEDPGSLKYHLLQQKNRNIFLINAFAANDRDSTEIIWERVKKENLALNKPKIYALINHRSDRAFRLKEFSAFLSKKNRFDGYILSGALKFRQKYLIKKNTHKKLPILNLKPKSIFNNYQKVNNFFSELEKDNDLIIFGCGNIHGDAEIVIDYFKKNGVVYK